MELCEFLLTEGTSEIAEAGVSFCHGVKLLERRCVHAAITDDAKLEEDAVLASTIPDVQQSGVMGLACLLPSGGLQNTRPGGWGRTRAFDVSLRLSGPEIRARWAWDGVSRRKVDRLSAGLQD